MSSFDMFCERCGTRYGPTEPTSESVPLGRRIMAAFGRGSETATPKVDEPLLRFCLACRGYNCPNCWNDEAGFCQGCVPLPEPPPQPVEEPTFALPAAVGAQEAEAPTYQPWTWEPRPAEAEATAFAEATALAESPAFAPSEPVLGASDYAQMPAAAMSANADHEIATAGGDFTIETPAQVPAFETPSYEEAPSESLDLTDYGTEPAEPVEAADTAEPSEPADQISWLEAAGEQAPSDWAVDTASTETSDVEPAVEVEPGFELEPDVETEPMFEAEAAFAEPVVEAALESVDDWVEETAVAPMAEAEAEAAEEPPAEVEYELPVAAFEGVAADLEPAAQAAPEDIESVEPEAERTFDSWSVVDIEAAADAEPVVDIEAAFDVSSRSESESTILVESDVEQEPQAEPEPATTFEAQPLREPEAEPEWFVGLEPEWYVTLEPEEFYGYEMESAAEPAAAEPEPVAAEPERAAEVAEPEPVTVEPEPEPVAAEPVLEAEVAEPEPVAAESEAFEPAVEFQPELQPEPVAVEFQPEPEPVAAEPEPEPVAVEFQPEPQPEPVAAEPEAVAAEPEPVEPVPAPELPSFPSPRWPTFEPREMPAFGAPPGVAPSAPEVAPAPLEVAPSAPEVAPSAPALGPKQPTYTPLSPIGPILPPLRPPVERPVAPRIEFDPAAAPPAYLIAQDRPPQAQPAAPQFPAGLFDTPPPPIRPCHKCQLPLSARAHFCRRCGSPQG